MHCSDASLLHLRTKGFPDSREYESWPSVVTCFGAAFIMLSAPKETLGSIHVTSGAEHRIHQIAFTVNGRIEKHHFPFHLEIRLIHDERRPTFTFRLRRMRSAYSGASTPSNPARLYE